MLRGLTGGQSAFNIFCSFAQAFSGALFRSLFFVRTSQHFWGMRRKRVALRYRSRLPCGFPFSFPSHSSRSVSFC